MDMRIRCERSLSYSERTWTGEEKLRRPQFCAWIDEAWHAGRWAAERICVLPPFQCVLKLFSLFATTQALTVLNC